MPIQPTTGRAARLVVTGDMVSESCAVRTGLARAGLTSPRAVIDEPACGPVVPSLTSLLLNAPESRDEKDAGLGQDVKRTENRARPVLLTAPLDGAVQQLVIHTQGGGVTPARALMVIVPKEDQAEVEAVFENKDIGFVKPGQATEIKGRNLPLYPLPHHPRAGQFRE